jgi:hypothetical protein
MTHAPIPHPIAADATTGRLGALLTRADYMAHSNEPGSHRRFYAQFVNAATISTVARFIGHDALMRSTDPHMNDIPLAKWDRLAGRLPLAIRFADVGDYPTLAGWVCIAKEAARQYIERQAVK